MTPEELFKLLPPLAAPPPPAEGESAVSTLAPVSFTDEEFGRIVRGEVLLSGAGSSAREVAAQTVAAIRGKGDESVPLQGKEASVDAYRPHEVASQELLDAYVEAAALRYTFRIDQLTPVPRRPGMKLPRYEALDPPERDAVFAYLTGLSDTVGDAQGYTRWLLRDRERSRALARLLGDPDRERVKRCVRRAREDAAREAKEGPRELGEAGIPAGAGAMEPAPAAHLVEETLWDYLTGKAASPETQDRRQLVVTRRVVGWVGSLGGLPGVQSLDEVDRLLARESLLEPFRHLTGEWREGQFESLFTGREEELDRLYDYLSVVPPESLRRRLSRAVRRLADTTWRLVNRSAGHRPLLIHGPGGIGKSTLLAKFLLDHLTETEPRNRFPYAYLDFDLSALNPREPLTLLAEAARQLADQFPACGEQWRALREEWLETAHLVGSGRTTLVASGALARFVEELRAGSTGGSTVADQFSRQLPFLLVLDTFEEVQYDHRDAVKDLFRFLNALRDRIPTLRVVTMGRAPLADVQEEYAELESVVIEGDVFGTGVATDFDVIEVPLGDLDANEAREYLQREGVSDPLLAEELVEVVGGSPLSLRLIAGVLREGAVDLRSLREAMKWRPSLGERLRGRKIPPKVLLQGVLMDRILGHIRSAEAKKLAHPGLVLRRITPELIAEVLAVPCGLGRITIKEAQPHFESLAREVALVATVVDSQGGRVLQHRPELRRIMLRLMEADEERQGCVLEVHRGAADYYAKLRGRAAREEELYHCLMLAELPEPEPLLDDVPTEEAVDAGYAPPPLPETDPRPIWRALAGAAEELPPVAVSYLAARIHRELVPDSAWDDARPEDRELHVLGRASRRARESGYVESALLGLRHDRRQLLQKPSLSALSPLPLMEAALLQRIGRHSEAEQLAKRASDAVHGAKWPATRRRLEYALLRARSAAHLEPSSACELHLHVAVEALWRLRETGVRVEAADRGERQLLRFATECLELAPTPRIQLTVGQSFLRLLEAGGFLVCPALARRAAISVFASDAGNEDGGDVVRRATERVPTLLFVLLHRLPMGAAAYLAETLADWSVAAMESEKYRVLARLLRLPVGHVSRETVHAAWRLVLSNPGVVLRQLSKVLEGDALQSGNVEVLQQLFRVLLTALVESNAAEDLLEDARRLGDLIPGEGRSVTGSAAL